MATVAFDTLKLARALRDAHFTNEQAEGAAGAIAEAIQSDLVTKSDFNAAIAGLTARLGAFEPEFATLKTDGAGMKADIAVLKSDVATLKSDVANLKSDVATLKSDVANLKSDVAVLKSDVATLKSDVASLKSDVAALKSDFAAMKVELASLRKDLALSRDETKAFTLAAIADAKVDMIKWGVGIAIVQGGFIVGLLRLLH